MVSSMDIYVIPGHEYDSNVYVIPGKVPTIIDTGTGLHAEQVIETIQSIIPFPKIQQILLTHEHYDHVGGVEDFVRRSIGHAKVCAHRDIVQKLREGKSAFAEMLGGKMPRIIVDEPLKDGTELTIGNERYQVLFTPGHSVGSLCIYGRQNQFLFSGDTIFANGGFGRYDFPGGDYLTLLHSITRLAQLKVACLYPGHGPFVKGGVQEHILLSLQNIRSMM